MRVLSASIFVLFLGLSTTLCGTSSSSERNAFDSDCEVSELESSDEDSDDEEIEMPIEDIPSPKKLATLFPAITIAHNLSFDETRTILFLYFYKKFKPSEIGLITNIDASVIVDIIQKSGLSKISYDDFKIKEKCYEAYLKFFNAIAKSEINRVQFATALSSHPDIRLSADQLLNVFKRVNRKRLDQRALTNEELDKIVQDYKGGTSLFFIADTYKKITRADDIVAHLANVLSPSEIRDELNLTFLPTRKPNRVRHAKTLKSFVVEIFNTLSDDQKRNPKRHIDNILRQSGYTAARSSVSRILRQGGLTRTSSNASTTNTSSQQFVMVTPQEPAQIQR